jgi:hypothetical protein
MCNCKKDIESRLLARFKEQSHEATDHYVELQGYGLAIIDNTLKSMPYMPFKTSAKFPLKKGGSKQKSQSSNMFFNYCPFCGEKIEKGGAQ